MTNGEGDEGAEGRPPSPYDQVPIPMLLREARSTYRQVIRVFLAEAGFEDVPRNGAFVLGSIANHGMPQEEIVQALQVSKQAASQLIDALVVRGYLERVPDASDRRRITLNATERGRAAGNAVRAGVRNLDLELTKRLAPEDMVVFRAGLIALAEIGEAGEKSPSPDDF